MRCDAKGQNAAVVVVVVVVPGVASWHFQPLRVKQISNKEMCFFTGNTSRVCQG